MTDTSFANRNRLIAALAPYGIKLVTIIFDGSSDEGQIESITACNAANESLDLPDITVEFVNGGTSLPLAGALENFAYDTLGELHGGWEDNDGAYGTVRLVVATGRVILDFNARFTDSHNIVTEF